MVKTKINNILQISEDGLTVEKCMDKTVESIAIPENVKYIDNDAFCDCKNLKTITFPNSLILIERDAFYNCRNLEELDLSKTKLVQIGTSAFSYYRNLKAVHFSEKLLTICNCAFRRCGKLSDISSLPQKDISVAVNAFEGCPITAFSHPAINIKNSLVIDDNCVSGFTGIQPCFEVKVPENVDTIQNGAIIDDGINELHIGDGIKIIKPEAIMCESLLLLKLPASLERLSKHAFGEEWNPAVIENCSNVKIQFKGTTVVEHDENITYSVRDRKFVIGVSKDNNKVILVYACPDYSHYELEIPRDVTHIHYDAFRNCKDHYITLPDSLILETEPDWSEEEQECVYGENKFLLPSGAQINRYFKAEPCEETILEKVKRLVVENCGICGEKVTESSNFIEDLGCDSLDTIELVKAFEEEFGCEILDEDTQKLLTVNDVVKYIESHI